WHFAPTQGSLDHLTREGLPPAGLPGARAVVTGNTVIDALLLAAERVRATPSAHEDVQAVRAWKDSGTGRRVILVTGHRRENFGAPFESFCDGLRTIATQH